MDRDMRGTSTSVSPNGWEITGLHENSKAIAIENKTGFYLGLDLTYGETVPCIQITILPGTLNENVFKNHCKER